MILPITSERAAATRASFPREHFSDRKKQENTTGGRIAVFLYGLACYAIFFASFLYAIGFLGNVFVSKSIDSAPHDALPKAFLVNTLLLGIFAIQHSHGEAGLQALVD